MFAIFEGEKNPKTMGFTKAGSVDQIQWTEYKVIGPNFNHMTKLIKNQMTKKQLDQIVVYLDQQKGAPHTVCWSKS